MEVVVESKYYDYRGLDCTYKVEKDIIASGLPLTFWEQFPEFHMKGFAGSILPLYLSIKDWTLQQKELDGI